MLTERDLDLLKIIGAMDYYVIGIANYDRITITDRWNK